MNDPRSHQRVLGTGEERAREFEYSADSQELWDFFAGTENILENPNRSDYWIAVQNSVV